MQLLAHFHNVSRFLAIFRKLSKTSCTQTTSTQGATGTKIGEGIEGAKGVKEVCNRLEGLGCIVRSPSGAPRTKTDFSVTLMLK